MKVLLVNGSPRKEGCTYTALKEVASVLEKNGIGTEFFHIGTGPVYGCVFCSKCRELKKCVIEKDVCNELAEKIAQADGLVIGSPVYYAGINGALSAILDRVFFSSTARFRNKPAAGVVNCRRGGAASAFDKLNKYFTIAQMPVVSSTYWNATHGFEPEDVKKDLEGMQVMRGIGNNMAWLIKAIKESGPPPDLGEKRAFTSFHDGK